MNGRDRHDGNDGMDTDPRLDAIYAALPDAEPPAAIDDAVLAAARREAGSRPRPVRARWVAPLATAAVVVLSVTVVTMSQRHVGSGRAGREDHVSTAPAPAAPPPAADAAAPQRGGGPGTEVRRRAAEETALGEEKSLRKSAPAAPAPMPGPATTFPRKRSSEPLQQERDIVGEPAATGALTGGSRPETQSESAREAAKMQAAPAAAPAKDVESDSAAWLERIERLVAAGDVERARAELERFRARYPDHPVPEPLAARLAGALDNSH